MREMALFSTYNKDGIGSIARALAGQGMEIVATGKTRSQLESEGLKVRDISELTGEPERFGGRLKTLHHAVLGGVLFRPQLDEAEWPYDFRVAAVVCNFYPFEEEAPKCETLEALTEWIDIGGPAMVRAAAKNHKHVWVFTKADQYTRFIASPEPDLRLRERFALEAFEEVAQFDEAIVYNFQIKQPWAGGGALSYGENPHQSATFWPNRKAGPKFCGTFSYNNVRDAEAAFRFVNPFKGPAVGVMKHQTLCGAAAGLPSAKPEDVFDWAWEGDVVSRFGGVLAFNFLPGAAITEILRKKFVEVVVVPRTEDSEKWADELRKDKERLKILLLDPSWFGAQIPQRETHIGILGQLSQTSDSIEMVDTDIDPAKLHSAFGQWAGACSKSNAMAIAGFDEKTQTSYLAGVGQGQPNRVDALKLLALPRAADFAQRQGVKLSEMSCFSDAFLPFDDCVHALKEAGVMRLVQPGGSKMDEQVADTAHKLGVEMIVTGRRHFWH